MIIAYDKDEAGTKSTLKCIKLLKAEELKCKVLDLHPYKDPHEFIMNNGKGAFQQRIQDAANPFFYEIWLKEKDFNISEPASSTEFQWYIGKKLCEFTEPLERWNYLEAVARKYSIDEESLREIVMYILADDNR